LDAPQLGQQKIRPRSIRASSLTPFFKRPKKNGAELIIGEVDGILKNEKEIVGVSISGKTLNCSKLIIAMGPWSFKLREWLPDLKIPRVTCQKAHSIVIKEKLPVSPHALFLSYSTVEGKSETPEVYPRPDGTIYMCGLAENSPLPEDASQVIPSEGKCERLHRMANELYPESCGDLLAAQACFFAPFFGQLTLNWKG